MLRPTPPPILFDQSLKATIFQWTQLEHDVVMRSPERGQIWENIVAALNSLQQPKLIIIIIIIIINNPGPKEQ